MRRRWGLIGLCAGWLAIAAQSHAQARFADFPSLSDIERVSLASGDGHRLDVLRHAAPGRRPALVIVPGSLCAPVFAAIGTGAEAQAYATVPRFPASMRAALDAHVVYLERRNIVSLETMSSAPEFSIEQVFRLSPCSERNGGLTLEQRAADVHEQLRWLGRQDWVASIHLVGVSEGSDVVAGVAAVDGSVADSMMLIGGAGPSQFADFAVFARGRNDTAALREAFADLDRFLAGRAPAEYKGYAAERWHSFAVRTSTLDSLLRSEIPLFIAHGERDESVPAVSADVVAVEVMRAQPHRAVFYWSVLGGDHMLATASDHRLPELVAAYLAWARSTPAGRTFRAD